MVDKYVQVRTQLENKIFVPYGRTATLYYNPSITYNDYGEINTGSTTYNELAITIVDYDIITSRLNYQRFAKVREGERTFITDYSSSIEVDDYLYVDSQLFKVVNVETPRLPEVIVNIVDVVKSNDTVTVGVIYLLTESGDNLVTEAGDQLISG